MNSKGKKLNIYKVHVPQDSPVTVTVIVTRGNRKRARGFFFILKLTARKNAFFTFGKYTYIRQPDMKGKTTFQFLSLN